MESFFTTVTLQLPKYQRTFQVYDLVDGLRSPNFFSSLLTSIGDKSSSSFPVASSCMPGRTWE
jgi:hypothetical protein